MQTVCELFLLEPNPPRNPNVWAANQISFIYTSWVTFTVRKTKKIKGDLHIELCVFIWLRMLLCLLQVKLVDLCWPPRSNLRRCMFTEPSVSVAHQRSCWILCVFVSEWPSVWSALLLTFNKRAVFDQHCHPENQTATVPWLTSRWFILHFLVRLEVECIGQTKEKKKEKKKLRSIKMSKTLTAVFRFWYQTLRIKEWELLSRAAILYQRSTTTVFKCGLSPRGLQPTESLWRVWSHHHHVHIALINETSDLCCCHGYSKYRSWTSFQSLSILVPRCLQRNNAVLDTYIVSNILVVWQTPSEKKKQSQCLYQQEQENDQNVFFVLSFLNIVLSTFI